MATHSLFKEFWVLMLPFPIKHICQYNDNQLYEDESKVKS